MRSAAVLALAGAASALHIPIFPPAATSKPPGDVFGDKPAVPCTGFKVGDGNSFRGISFGCPVPAKGPQHGVEPETEVPKFVFNEGVVVKPNSEPDVPILYFDGDDDSFITERQPPVVDSSPVKEPPVEEPPVEEPPVEEPPVEAPVPWTPPPPPADPSWEAAYRRCFTDGAHGVRALDFGGGVDKKFLTIDVCLAACASKGFKLAGLEYGTECYCGNTLQGENKPTLDEHCDLPCLGNNKTTCGGRGALALYVKDQFDFTEGRAFDGLGPGFDGYEPVGCYQDFHALDRTLKVDALRGPEQQTMTPELCIADCQARGFPLAGLEYGRQCFCGHDRSGLSNKTEDFFCNQGCTGNAQLFCGGNWNLVIYSKSGLTPAIAPPPPPPPPPPPLPVEEPPVVEPPVVEPPVEEHPVKVPPPVEESPVVEPPPTPAEPAAIVKDKLHHRPDDMTTLHRRRPATDKILPPPLEDEIAPFDGKEVADPLLPPPDAQRFGLRPLAEMSYVRAG